jgi:hypothetical protein
MPKFKIYYIDTVIVNALKSRGEDVSDISKINPSTTECNMRSPREVIEFYGLNQPDVLWYKIEEI